MALHLAASEHWGGNDGPWSLFSMEIGTPPQNLLTLPATSQQGILVVLPEGCRPSEPSGCDELRGGVFRRENFTDWNPQRSYDDMPYYHVPFTTGIDLATSVNTEQCLTAMSLQVKDQDAPTKENVLADQLVGGYAAKSPFIGWMGLSSMPVSLSGLSTVVYTFVREMIRINNSTGLSWAYTAGANYRSPEYVGSLTFGGYDASKAYLRTAPTFERARVGNERDLIVTIDNIVPTITSDDDRTYPLLGAPIQAFLNSAESDIWLPEDVCETFESQLGLIYNTTADMYLINSTLETSLQDTISGIDFVLTNSSSSENSLTISLPLAAFIKEVRWPLANITDTETPLKRFASRKAPTPGVTTLGPTFFQEAYVMIDYDRSQFKVAEAQFSKDSPTRLVTVYPPGHTASLTRGAIAGIVVGAVATLTTVAALIWWLRRRRARLLASRTRAQNTSQPFSDADGVDLSDQTVQELSEDARTKPELEADASGTAPHARWELQAGSVRRRAGTPVELP